MARTHENWIAEIFAGLSPGDIDDMMRLLGKAKASTARMVAGKDAP
jgi:hypothetical protein